MADTFMAARPRLRIARPLHVRLDEGVAHFQCGKNTGGIFIMKAAIYRTLPNVVAGMALAALAGLYASY